MKDLVGPVRLGQQLLGNKPVTPEVVQCEEEGACVSKLEEFHWLRADVVAHFVEKLHVFFHHEL